jgi:hypothetical protein
MMYSFAKVSQHYIDLENAVVWQKLVEARRNIPGGLLRSFELKLNPSGTSWGEGRFAALSRVFLNDVPQTGCVPSPVHLSTPFRRRFLAHDRVFLPRSLAAELSAEWSLECSIYKLQEGL